MKDNKPYLDCHPEPKKRKSDKLIKMMTTAVELRKCLDSFSRGSVEKKFEDELVRLYNEVYVFIERYNDENTIKLIK